MAAPPIRAERRAFRSLFAASLIGFGVYAAVKAAYVSTVFSTTVQERNLIYLVPLVFAGTALWLDRPRLRWAPLAAAVGFVAYLIVSTPYLLTTVPASDAFGVAIAQMANRNLSFAHGGVEHALVIALAIGVALLVAPRFLGRRPRGSGAVLALAAVLVLAWSLTGQISAANYSNNESQLLVQNYPRPLNWLDKLTHGNAIRHYRFDPFAGRPREECTVGALRARATDVDVAPRSAGRPRGERLRRASDLTRTR